jgi:hypothetical protein
MTTAKERECGAPTTPDDARREDASVEQCRAALTRARERLARRGPVDIRLVRRSVGEAVTRGVLDACLLQLESEGSVVLTPHARPEALDALELRDCVASPRGPLYFVSWLG